MIALESWCIPVVLGGVPVIRNEAKMLNNKQEYKVFNVTHVVFDVIDENSKFEDEKDFETVD